MSVSYLPRRNTCLVTGTNTDFLSSPKQVKHFSLPDPLQFGQDFRFLSTKLLLTEYDGFYIHPVAAISKSFNVQACFVIPAAIAGVQRRLLWDTTHFSLFSNFPLESPDHPDTVPL